MALIFNTSVSNFHNLAIFICHLIVEGHFWSGHIIHDSTDKSTNIPQMITEIQLTCPESILWFTTDINTRVDANSSTSPKPWRQNENTDSILQLIFFDPENHLERINDLKSLITFYHLFVVLSADESIVKKHNADFLKLNSDLLSRSSILHVSPETVFVYGISFSNRKKTKFSDIELLYTQNELKNISLKIFNVLSEKSLENFEIIINHSTGAPCSLQFEVSKKLFEALSSSFYANFFYSNLNAAFLNISNRCGTFIDPTFQPKHRRFYKELTADYEPINNGNAIPTKVEQSNIIHFNLDAKSSSMCGESKTVPLYPFRSTELAVLFVYAVNSTRERYRVSIGEEGAVLLLSVLSFYFLMAAVLCYIRRKCRMRRDGYISSFIDISITFIGGGNLTMAHKLERLILGILLIGSFFLGSFWLNVVLFPSFLTFDSSIKTFNDLAKVNPPIYSALTFMDHQYAIEKMLNLKLGQNSKYEGSKAMSQLIQYYNNSFAFILDKMSLKFVTVPLISRHVRDIDVLEESLGALSSGYFLTSNGNIPKPIQVKIDGRTSAMVENGLHRFYETFSSFVLELRAIKFFGMAELDEEQPVTVEQLWTPIVMYLVCCGMCCVVFLFEIIVFKWKQRNKTSIVQSEQFHART